MRLLRGKKNIFRNKEKIRRVGIVTLYGHYNYGNRLQNLAVHMLVEELGYYPETIIAVYKPLLNCLKVCIKHCLGFLGNRYYQRYVLFKGFDKELLN